MKKIVSLILFLVITYFGNAQNYSSAIGLRAGWDFGLTAKHFISDKAALEGIFSSRWRGFNITGLYEVHHSIDDLEGLDWYVGGGAHVGFYDDRYYNGFNTNSGRTYTVLGVDGIIGLDYTFKDYPINISADWKPTINFTGTVFGGDNGAVSIRYVF